MREAANNLSVKTQSTALPVPVVDASDGRLAWLVCLLLAGICLVLFWPVVNFDFIKLDDQVYVYDNAHVLRGLTWEEVKWAFTTLDAGFWQPLTWLSYMADVTIFGKGAGGFHFTNLLLHAANAALLFLLLRQLTGALWRSALVAVLFAWHPLHVEPVAWIASRKDVLSAFFGFLSLLFYTRYAQLKIANRKSQIANYLLSLFFFTLGLMSKTMLVTLPVVMLLLDYWPLKRLAIGDWRLAIGRLVWEKLPFLAVAAFTGLLTVLAEKKTGALPSVIFFPIEVRMANALLSYVHYLWQTLWPVGLAVYYPFPMKFAIGPLVAAGWVMVMIFTVVVWQVRRRPYLAVGWLWYVITLLPVIGLIQIGSHAHADRYTYVPIIGVFIALVWMTGQIWTRWRLPRMLAVALAAVVLFACLWRARAQLQCWQDTETLFCRTLAVTKANYLACTQLGYYLCEQGRYREATDFYQQAVQILPGQAFTHNNLGTSLRGEGKLDEAVVQFREAVRLSPDYLKARRNLAATLDALGENDEAIAHYGEVMRLSPGDVEAEYRLSVLLDRVGRSEEAMAHGRRAVLGRPDYAEARQQLGELLVRVGDKTNAVAAWREVMRLRPGWPAPLNSLAWLRATDREGWWRNGAEAVRLGERAAQVTTNRVPEVLDTLAAAYAESGRYEEAIKTAQRAIELAEASGKEKLAVEIRRRLKLYKAGRPYRE